MDVPVTVFRQVQDAVANLKASGQDQEYAKNPD